MTFDLHSLEPLGLPGLFIAAFLAGSILPLPSEGVLVALLASGTHPALAVAVGTLGNVLGAVTIYAMGRTLGQKGEGRFARWAARRLQRDPASLERGVARMRRYGAPALLLAWVPIAGDAFVLGAGFIGMGFARFLLFVSCGKAVRYLVVAALLR